MASMDGTVWTEITTSKAVNSTDMQTLSVAAACLSICSVPLPEDDG